VKIEKEDPNGPLVITVQGKQTLREVLPKRSRSKLKELQTAFDFVARVIHKM